MPQYRAFTADTTLPASDPNAVQRYEYAGAPWPTPALHRKFVYAGWRPVVELSPSPFPSQ